MQTLKSFPGIRKVALEIAYDNGMIDRDNPEEAFLQKVDEIVAADGVDYSVLKQIDDWINTLSEEEIQILAVGEHVEMVALTSKFSDPEKLDIFNDIFEI